VNEYHRLVQAGVLEEDEPVELLEGWIVEKIPRNPLHDAVVSLILNRVLAPRLPAGWFCRGQSAITTTDSEPEPDIAVVRGNERDYLARHPGPADIGDGLRSLGDRRSPGGTGRGAGALALTAHHLRRGPRPSDPPGA
jgi:hypothetical protein